MSMMLSASFDWKQIHETKKLTMKEAKILWEEQVAIHKDNGQWSPVDDTFDAWRDRVLGDKYEIMQ